MSVVYKKGLALVTSCAADSIHSIQCMRPSKKSGHEEAELVTRSIGYARSKKEVITMVEAVLSSKGKANSVSSGWWESFIKRHLQLCIRKAEKVTYARLKATDPIVMDNPATLICLKGL